MASSQPLTHNPHSKRILKELSVHMDELESRYAIADPYYWMTTATRTRDGQSEIAYKPFPDRPYIRAMIDQLKLRDRLVVWKSRTMLGSWTGAAYAFHYMATHEATGVLIQSQDEARALNMIEYMKVLWDQSTQRLKEKWRLPPGKELGKQAMHRFELDNGSTAVGIPGGSTKIKSYHPTIYLVDEGAIIDDLSDHLSEALATRCKQVIIISSAHPGELADMWRECTPVKEYAPPEGSTGISLHHNKKGYYFLSINYRSDTTLTQQRLKELRAAFPTDAHWRREMEQDPDALGGQLVYPDYDEHIHVIPDKDIPTRGCLYMSIDPHPRVPHAALWLLVDRYGDYYIYRELWPSIMKGVYRKQKDSEQDNLYSVREYCEALAKLEGNTLDILNEGTGREHGLYRRLSGGERVVYRLMDQAGKGFKASDESALTDTYAKRYVRYGIVCGDPTKSHSVGEDAIHDALIPRKHETAKGGVWPRLHIAESLEELRVEMRHYRYAQSIMVSDREITHRTATLRTHMIDNLRYLLTRNPSYSERLESPRYMGGVIRL